LGIWVWIWRFGSGWRRAERGGNYREKADKCGIRMDKEYK